MEAMAANQDEYHNMPALDPVPEPEETFEEFLDGQVQGTYNPGATRDQSERNHRYIQDMMPHYNRQQLEVFHRIFVRNNLLVTVEGPPRSGRTRTAAGYADLRARLMPNQLTLVITPLRQDAINFVNAYHEMRSSRDPTRLLLILERRMEFDQISRDSFPFGIDLITDHREETAQQYQLLAHLRAAAARIRRIGDQAAHTANELRALQLIDAYENNITRHPRAAVSTESLPELACIFNEVQIIVSTLEELLRFPRILNSTQHLVFDNANQIQHAEVHLLASHAQVRTIVAFGSNQLLQPHRSPDQNGFPQNNLRSIFAHLRYHAPYGNVDFRTVYSTEPNLMEILDTINRTTNTAVRPEPIVHRHIPFARQGFPILLLQCPGAQDQSLTWTRCNRIQCQLAFDLLRELCRIRPRGRICISTYYMGDCRRIATLI